MKSLWNAPDHAELQQRVARLTPRHAAKWGKLSAPQVVVHLTDSLRMASGELVVAPKNVPVRYPPLKQLVIYWLPMFKGLPTAPELVARAPGEWNDDIAALRRELDSLVRRGTGAVAPAHPAFGRMSPREWGVLVYRHMDHHLRQFGV
jgi:hypothetical protein